MDNNLIKPNTGSGLGTAGLILGIISLPLAIIGCTSGFAMVLAIVGVALSAVALSQARKVSSPSSLITAALVLCIISLGFSILRVTNSIVKIHKFPWEIVNKKLEHLEEDGEEFGRIFEEEFEKEIGGNLEEVLKELEDELESMEEDLEEAVEELEDVARDITDEEEAARKLGRAAGRAVREFVDELNDSTNIKVEIEID